MELSQRPADHKPAHIVYRVDDLQESDEQKSAQMPETLPPHTALVPRTCDEDGLYRLRLSKDAEELGEMIGAWTMPLSFCLSE